MEVRATLGAHPSCVASARRLTERTLTRWGLTALRDVASLLVSELTTNAILHARSSVTVSLSNDSADLLVCVYDTSPLLPRIRNFSRDSGTGRGVRLLNSLASNWGVDSKNGGKCVWFTLSANSTQSIADWEFNLDAVEPL